MVGSSEGQRSLRKLAGLLRGAPFKHKNCLSQYSGSGDASGDQTSLAKQRSQDGCPVQTGSTLGCAGMWQGTPRQGSQIQLQIFSQVR